MSVTAQNMAKKAVRTANNLVNFAVLAAILLLLAFGCYALWDSNQVYNTANAAQYEIYKPTVENEGKTFQELQAINPEVFSWLTVYGTNIDYPVTQGGDNMKYVNTNAEGSYSLSGSIFLDYENSRDFSDFNSILFGHHMEKQAMFGEIGLFSDKDYFNARLYGSLYYNGTDHGLEFFAFLHTDAYDAAVFAAGISGEARQAYLDGLLDKATFTRDIGVTVKDRIVLLSTCSAESTNGRDILIARITDDTFDDAFKPTEINNTGMQAAADGQPGIWAWLPAWPWIALSFPAAIIILSIVIYHKRKHFRHTKAENENKQKEQ